MSTELTALRLAGLAPSHVFPTEGGDGSGYYEGDLPLFEVTRGARLHIGVPRPGITEKTMCGKSAGNAAGLFHAPRPLCPRCRALFNAIDAGPDAVASRRRARRKTRTGFGVPSAGVRLARLATAKAEGK